IIIMVPTKDISRVAAIHTVTSTQLGQNLDEAAALIGQAVQDGAELIVLPEYFCLMGNKDRDKLAIKEALGSGPIQEFLSSQASMHGIWLVGGTLPLDCGQADRIYNTTLVYDPFGVRVAR